MSEAIKVAQTRDVPPGTAIGVDVGGTRIALFNVAGTFYAIDDTCTHAGGPLSEGEFSEAKVTCPWHGASFDLLTGRALNPPASRDVKFYKVQVTGDDVLIEA